MPTIEEYMQATGIPKRFLLAKLSDSTMGDLVSHHMSNNQGMFFTGPKGAGKTHLLAAAIRLQIEPVVKIKQKLDHPPNTIQKHAIFWPITELLYELRQCYNTETNTSEKTIVESCIKVPWLYLDDLGTEKTSDWTLQILYMIINARYGDMKPIIVTSNFNSQQLSTHIGDRVASRIMDICKIVKISGEDRRIK